MEQRITSDLQAIGTDVSELQDSLRKARGTLAEKDARILELQQTVTEKEEWIQLSKKELVYHLELNQELTERDQSTPDTVEKHHRLREIVPLIVDEVGTSHPLRVARLVDTHY